MGKASRGKRERRAAMKIGGAMAPRTTAKADFEPTQGLTFDIEYMGERMSGHELALRALEEDDVFKLQVLQMGARAFEETIIDMSFEVAGPAGQTLKLTLAEAALAHGSRHCLHFLLANCQDRLEVAEHVLRYLIIYAATLAGEPARFAKDFLKENYRFSRARGEGGEDSFIHFATALGYGAVATDLLAEVMAEERAESDREILNGVVPERAPRTRSAAAL